VGVPNSGVPVPRTVSKFRPRDSGVLEFALVYIPTQLGVTQSRAPSPSQRAGRGCYFPLVVMSIFIHFLRVNGQQHVVLVALP
jgi:hypothetical protein